jgi:hypothetical protein
VAEFARVEVLSLVPERVHAGTVADEHAVSDVAQPVLLAA